MAERHVVTNPLGGWDVIVHEPRRVSSHHLTRDDAAAWAAEIVRSAGGGMVVVHDNSGDVVERLEIGLLTRELLFASAVERTPD